VGTASGAVDVSQVIAAVDWVVKHRADDTANPIKVINLSYGSGGTPDEWNDSLGFAVEKAWRSGIVVVAAAGNDGSAADRLANPASDEWILSVGAAVTNGTVATADDSLAAFTNLPKGGKQINVLAPGVSVLSLRDNGSSVDIANPSAREGDTLFRGSGTSQAAAVVSGAAALLIAQRPALSPDQVKALLRSGARPLAGADAWLQGAGAIDVAASSAAVAPRVRQSFLPARIGGWLRQSPRIQYAVENLKGSRWSGSRWSGSRWSGSRWSGSRWSGSRWSGSRWSGSRWSGSRWSSTVWGDAPAP